MFLSSLFENLAVLINIMSKFTFQPGETLLIALQELISNTFPHQRLELILFLCITFFTGCNFALLSEMLHTLHQMGTITWAVGGGGLVGIFAAGCASCGFSALALLGSSSGISFLVSQGQNLMILSLFVLVASFIYNIRHFMHRTSCQIF